MQLVPVLVKAVQELSAEVKTIKTTIKIMSEEVEVYTQEQADKDIFASMDSVDICERVQAVYWSR